MNAFLVGLCICCVAQTCGAYEPTQYEKDITESRQNLKDISQLIAAFRQNEAKQCADSGMVLAKTTALLIEARSGVYHRSLAPQYRDQYSRVQLRAMLDAIEALDPMAVSALFAVADTYKEAHCLDEADKLYRGIEDKYVGDSYAAYRERAHRNIEDVREMRRK